MEHPWPHTLDVDRDEPNEQPPPAPTWDWIPILANDHSMVLVSQYPEALDQLLACLDHPEPVIQLVTLRAAATACMPFAIRWITCSADLVRLGDALANVLCGADSADLHNLVSTCLSRLIPLALHPKYQPPVPTYWLANLFQLAKSRLQSALGFTSIDTLATRLLATIGRNTQPPQSLLQSILSSIAFFGSFLGHLTVIEPTSEHLVHALLALLLRPDIVEHVSAATVHVLTEHLPKTNASRQIVEQLYRPLILGLFVLPEPGSAAALAAAAGGPSTSLPQPTMGTGGGGAGNSTRRVSFSTANALAKITYSPKHKAILSRFLAEWFPLPADATISALPDQVFSATPGTAGALSTGGTTRPAGAGAGASGGGRTSLTSGVNALTGGTGAAGANSSKDGYVFRRLKWLTQHQRFRPVHCTPEPLYSVPLRQIQSMALDPHIGTYLEAVPMYDTQHLWDNVQQVRESAFNALDEVTHDWALQLKPKSAAEAAARAMLNAGGGRAGTTTSNATAGLVAIVETASEAASRRGSIAPASSTPTGSNVPDQAGDEADASPTAPDTSNLSLMVHTADPVWEPDLLTLSIPHGQTLSFTRPPYMRQVYLTSKSATHALPFHVQVWPKDFFAVHPACGIVAPQASVILTVTFNARPHADRSVQEIDGFIRLRDRFGFPVCRFPLRGTILPAVHCPARVLDFGMCAPGDVRTLVLPVHNMTNTESNCSLATAGSSYGGAFLVMAPHFILQPKEQKILKIKFSPPPTPTFSSSASDHVYKDTLLLSTDTGELYEIALIGSAHPGFIVHTRKLDFGHVDMAWGPQTRSVVIENRCAHNLPLQIVASTKEIALAGTLDASTATKEFTLYPFETRKIQLTFRPAFNGARFEKVTVTGPFAPATNAAVVDLVAQVGKPVYTPLHEQAYFVPAARGRPSTLAMPIVNAAQAPCKVWIDVPVDVQVELRDAKGYNVEPVSVELVAGEGNAALPGGGYVVSMSGMGTAPVELVFASLEPGRWVIPVGVYLLKPVVPVVVAGGRATSPKAQQSVVKKVLISKHLVYAMTLSPAMLKSEKFLVDARSLFNELAPSRKPCTLTGTGGESRPGSGSAGSGYTSVDGDIPSSCFELDPPTLVLHGVHKLGKFQCAGTVSLSNVTSQRQNYHLLAPPWIKLSVPVDGSVPALSALDIPLLVEVPPRLAAPDIVNNLFLGFISVVDDKSPARGVSHAVVKAVVAHPVHLQVRQDLPTIQFPNTKVLTKVQRKIPVRNCLPVESVWEGRVYVTQSQNRMLGAKSGPGAGDGTAGAMGGAVAVGKGRKVVTMFSEDDLASTTALAASGGGGGAGTSTGDDDDVRNPFTLVVSKFILKPFAIAMVEVQLQATGTGKFSSQLEYELYTTQNTPPLHVPPTPSNSTVAPGKLQMLHAPIRCHSMVPNVTFARDSVMVAPGKSEVQTIVFAPRSSVFTTGFVHLSAHLWSSLIAVAGRAGELKLETSTGINLLGKMPAIQLGKLVAGKKKFLEFKIINRGTLDVVFLSMQVEPTAALSLDVIQEMDMLRPDVCDFVPADNEVDWDEVDVRQVEAATTTTVGGNRLISGRMSRRRDRKSVFGRGTVTVAAAPSPFPLLLRPQQSCTLVIGAVTSDLKAINGRLRARMLRLNGDVEELGVQITAEAIRPPYLSEKRIDFGICDALHRHVRKTKITNPSTSPLEWKLVFHPDHGFIMPGRTVAVSAKSLQFGVLGVGKTKSMQLQLEGGTVDVKVSFNPRVSGPFAAKLEIRYFSTDGYFYPPISVPLRGSGGYPDLYVYTQEIDFVSLSSYHPSIFLNEADPIIPPQSQHHLHIVFRPTYVETLNSKLFVKSADSRSDVFLVKVRGRVGVSRLSVTPLDAFKNLDFGTCLAPGTFTRTFKLKNTGNIVLSFNIKFTNQSEEYNPYSVNMTSGRVEVDEEFELEVSFRPRHMRTYTCKLEIHYDHHILSTNLVGIGGQMLINLLPSAKVFDFGLCRLNKVMKKEIAIDNKGNYGMPFQAFIADEPNGFTVVNQNGYCRPGDKTSVYIEFCPEALEPAECTLRIECGQETREVLLTGCGAESNLALLDANGEELPEFTPKQPPLVDLGIHPIGSRVQVMFKLVNEGPFGIDFFIEPFRVPELLITPQRGYIEPLSSSMLLLTFTPAAENTYTGSLHILWENEPIMVNIRAAGGTGKLDVKFTSQADLDQYSLDFGMIPIQSTLEKRFYLTNDGVVDELVALVIPPTKKPSWHLSSGFKQKLKPKHGIEVAVRYTAKQNASKCNLCISSETLQINMEVRGRGGTINIGHRGSLIFDDIAVRHTASRKLLLTNSGSISALLTLGWSLIRGGDNSGPYVELNETFGALDPRNGWARTQLIKDNGLPPEAKLEETEDNSKTPKLAAVSTIGLSAASLGLDVPGGGGMGGGNASSTHRSGFGLFKHVGSSAALKKNSYRIHAKRRSIFFSNVSHMPVTSQLQSTEQTFIRVEPSTCLLPGFGEVEVTVDINMPTEETFLATLHCIPNVPNTTTYEVALSATPRLVSVVMSDNRPVDFGCQPIGHREVIERIFTNVGHRPFAWILEQSNRSITVFPNRGYLDVGHSVMVQFAFEPNDESIQSTPAMFIPDCSQPIRIKILAAGGRSRMSLFKYKRFDFGHCMIGKDTHSSLPITNEGNAMLHLSKFELIPSDSFFKGPNWPSGRVSIAPGSTYQLPLVFNPHSESPNPGKLIVGNDSEVYDIQLTGIGREAVLIVTKVMLEYADCLIGNTYIQKLGLKNVGDVNYPVTFELEGAGAGLLQFEPSKLTIPPFSESNVQVIYKPVKEIKLHTTLSINSPYSVNTLPVVLHAGFASLSLSEEVISFGMFEKSSRPTRTFIIRNTGSVNINYSVRQSTKPHLFQVVNGKGNVASGKEVAVTITYIQNTVGHFTERLTIKTELQSVQYTVMVNGQCEEALVRHEEFALLNMGTCPVLETTTKSLSITNYGKFPLKFQVKNAYPIKVNKVVGEVRGESTEQLAVSWHPSGGYELRTQLHIVTNIGTFQVVIRGKAAFPELVLRNNYFDFGVCAIGHTYTETLELFNKGKVPLHWSIPNVRDCYSVSAHQGSLGPKESKDVQINFRPTAVGRYGSSFIIESRGQNFKEVALNGVGGTMLVDIPQTVNVGQCPCDHPITKAFAISNRGDVPIHATFTCSTNSADTFQLLSIPPTLLVRPGRTSQVYFSIKATQVGANDTSFTVTTREKKYTIQVRGNGVKIDLKPHVVELLQLDAILEAKDPLEIVLETDSLDLMLGRLLLGERSSSVTSPSLPKKYNRAWESRSTFCLRVHHHFHLSLYDFISELVP
ncbi:hypothetical protein BCR44DRAFT_1515800 [Catenaria anguillulae PL171]|uniref:HYDIN/VesB/CFA65-like Ig-like domain-containing protein n=1 Tax=Catenaria anguillulae PL171 TaxID=765915 RepID=A0A1Y2HBF9_9FUNG|nr:hypothetical protein BCR44DRAFT_1515800 [Catenaria anguillulae PL171]